MKKYRKDKLFITLFILDFCAFICCFIVYGPFSFFRDYWIPTGMATQSHQYLVYTFYNDSIIESVMSNNYVDMYKGTSDASAITFDNKEKNSYDSTYEEQVLKRDPDNDVYKVINLDINNTKGYLLVVYNPSNVRLATSKYIAGGGEKLDTLVKRAGGIAGINASGFYRNAETKAISPNGTTIENGKIKSITDSYGNSKGLIGFNYDNVLVLTSEDAETAIKNGMKDAMTFGPFLVVNGAPSFIKGNGGWGYAPRSAIGQRKDGIVLMIVFDGHGNGNGAGVSMADLTELFMSYGAYNAANLDGGGSSTMVAGSKVINNPKGWSYTGLRSIPNAWIVKDATE